MRPSTSSRTLVLLSVLLCVACSVGPPRSRSAPPRDREALRYQRLPPAPRPTTPPPTASPSPAPARPGAVPGTASPAPTPAPAAVAPPGPPQLGVRAQAALAEARLRVAEAKTRRPGWAQADELLSLTEMAAAQTDDALTLHYARLTVRRADLGLSDYYAGLARDELKNVYTHTGLSDLQLSRVQYIESALIRGDGRTGYLLASGLREELEVAAKPYRVSAGETLWQISGKAEVYGNSQLWPLIFDANRETMKTPSDLFSGKLLQIRTNPTIDEVVQAIDFARAHTPGDVHIGEIRVLESDGSP